MSILEDVSSSQFSLWLKLNLHTINTLLKNFRLLFKKQTATLLPDRVLTFNILITYIFFPQSTSAI